MMLLKNQILDKFQTIQQEGKTGVLKLVRDGKKIVFHFRKGLIDGAGSDMENLQLGKTLVRSFGLKAAILPRLLDQARRENWILGKAVVKLNHLDNFELKYGVREQIVQAATYAIYQDFQIDSFEEAAVDFYVPARMNVNSLMLELARKNFKPCNFDETQRIGLKNGHSLSHLPWYPQELFVLAQMRTPRTLQDLAGLTGIETENLNKILGVFDTLSLIKPVEDKPDEPAEYANDEDFPLQGLVPEISDASLSPKLETYNNAVSFISEQFNNLKVRISEVSSAAPLHAIAISSPQPGDGKSLICANLAVSFARDPKRRVVVVDCDMRNPTLHKYLGTSMEPGLLGYFEKTNLPPYCFLRKLGSLYVMTAGGVSENPVEHLSGPRMTDLIQYLKAEFNTIILDCPPFGPISDAQVLMGVADGLLLVVRSGKTSYRSLEKACRYLDRNKLIGLALNDVKPMLFNTEYDYRYYRYGNAYPYGSVKTSHRPKNYLE